MNNARRKSLTNIVEKIEDLKSDLAELLEEEQGYLDNMPENLQGSEKYERAEETVSALEEAVCNIEDAVDNIETAAE